MVNHHTGYAPSTVPSNLNQPCTKPSITPEVLAFEWSLREHGGPYQTRAGTSKLVHRLLVKRGEQPHDVIKTAVCRGARPSLHLSI
jgi:hypothetical protein